MLHQNQTQKQQLKILPQQIQLLNIFHLNSLDLEQRILDELNENPLLEEKYDEPTQEKPASETGGEDYQDWDEYAYNDIPDYKTEFSNYNIPEPPSRPLVERTDFRQSLKEQVCMLNLPDNELKLAEYMIDCLNEHGMLEQSLEEIAADLSFKNNEWIDAVELELIVKKLQALDPPGIAARSIQECLLLQLKRHPEKSEHIKLSIRLLEEHYQDLSGRNFEKIKKNLHIDDEDFKMLFAIISGLKLKPIVDGEEGLVYKDSIVSDFIITREGDRFEVSLNKPRACSLFVNQSLMSSCENGTKGSSQYLKSKLNSAVWFVNAIKQRESNMLKVMNAIIKLQRDYFLEGDVKHLKPMILKNVADIVGVDISTVSRITCNKYADTPFGTILLKDLFTEGIANKKGEVISNRVIQSAIEEVIEKEDKQHPYTDQQLAAILSAKGYNVARRTIAKYRDHLHIPMAQMRMRWIN